MYCKCRKAEIPEIFIGKIKWDFFCAWEFNAGDSVWVSNLVSDTKGLT
jgi:hypothetical protein